MSDQLAIFIDFENVALWAEREFFDFDVTNLIEHLQSRGPAVVKRAYADWSRFARYREAMMNNSIDLIQIFSVRTGKNRADIRMAIDAFEIAMTREQIHTFVIVSGDSDFGPLAAKLREYGRYTIGIGPRSTTHDLLVRSVDEFVYLETALGEPTDVDEQSCVEIEQARSLLGKALRAHGQRGELPVAVSRLKQTMLLMNPAFNEANFGYADFRTWLEDNRDIIKLFNKDLLLFGAPVDYVASDYLEVPVKETESTEGQAVPFVEKQPPVRQTLEAQYKQVLSRLKLTAIDLATRRDVLRDIYRELSERPGAASIEELLDILEERYETQGLIRSKLTLREILQLAFRQAAFDTYDQPVSPYAKVRLVDGIESESDFISRAESDILYAIVRSGLEIDFSELAYLMLNDRTQEETIESLLDDLKNRGLVVYKNKRYVLPGRGNIPFAEEAALRILIRDIEEVQLPDNVQPGVESARSLSKKAMLQRSQDFAASSTTYLLACRVQWDAVERGEDGATLEDLRWYMASYASAIAGKLSQVNRDYAGARPYYLAFFSLVREDDPLWGRMRGLINPMLAYYWSNSGRELDINVSTWNLSLASPAQIAVNAATHPNPDLRKLWYKITVDLAEINPGVLRRIASQLMLNKTDHPENARVAEQIETILDEVTPVAA
jgi:uncharacterized LabA/DUF88 family protein